MLQIKEIAQVLVQSTVLFASPEFSVLPKLCAWKVRTRQHPDFLTLPSAGFFLHFTLLQTHSHSIDRQPKGTGLRLTSEGNWGTGRLTGLSIVATLETQSQPRWAKIKLFWHLVHQSSFAKRDFPGGPVVKNPPDNAGDGGEILGWGNKISHPSEQPSLWAATNEALRFWSPRATPRESKLHNPAWHNRSQQWRLMQPNK